MDEGSGREHGRGTMRCFSAGDVVKSAGLFRSAGPGCGKLLKCAGGKTGEAICQFLTSSYIDVGGPAGNSIIAQMKGFYFVATCWWAVVRSRDSRRVRVAAA